MLSYSWTETLHDFLARPQAPSILLLVAFQILWSMLILGHGCHDIWVGCPNRPVHVKYVLPNGKKYNLTLSVVVIVGSEQKPCKDILATLYGGHHANQKVWKNYFDDLS